MIYLLSLNIAKDDVYPCRYVLSPIGLISPLEKNPVIGDLSSIIFLNVQVSEKVLTK